MIRNNIKFYKLIAVSTLALTIITYLLFVVAVNQQKAIFSSDNKLLINPTVIEQHAVQTNHVVSGFLFSKVVNFSDTLYLSVAKQGTKLTIVKLSTVFLAFVQVNSTMTVILLLLLAVLLIIFYHPNITW